MCVTGFKEESVGKCECSHLGLFLPRHLRLELVERPGWMESHAGLKARCKPYEKQTYIRACMLAWVYNPFMHTRELQAVMTVLPPRFSRYSTVERADAEDGRVITCKD